MVFHIFLLSKASAEPKTRDFRGNCSTPFPRDSLPRRIGSICVSSNTKHRNFPVADAQVEVEMPHSAAICGRWGVPSQAVTSRRKTKNGTTRSNVPFALANSQLNFSNFFPIVCPDNSAHSNASPCCLLKITPPLFTTVVSVSLSSFFFRPCSVPTKKGNSRQSAGGGRTFRRRNLR